MGVLKHYKELLPITPATPDVNLEEGCTPLIKTWNKTLRKI